MEYMLFLLQSAKATAAIAAVTSPTISTNTTTETTMAVVMLIAVCGGTPGEVALVVEPEVVIVDESELPKFVVDICVVEFKLSIVVAKSVGDDPMLTVGTIESLHYAILQQQVKFNVTYQCLHWRRCVARMFVEGLQHQCWY